MALRLAILAYCAVLAQGCIYSNNYGLLRNFWDDSDSGALVVGAQRWTDQTAAVGDSNVFDLTYPVNIHRDDRLFYAAKVCDNGHILLGTDNNDVSPKPCKSQTQMIGLDNDGTNNNDAIIIADAINNAPQSIVTAYYVDAYHGERAAQFDASNNVSGPSLCDLNIVAGIVADCEETHRKDLILAEMLIATWRIEYLDGTAKNHTFQSFIATTTTGTGNRTFVGFIYNDDIPSIPSNKNKRVVGKVIANTNGIAGPVERYSQICNSTTGTDIHLKSNCKCGKPGHYVFETTEAGSSQHEYCGTNKDTCGDQDYTKDDSMTINKNCKVPREPQDTCDGTTHCQIDGTSGILVIYFKNYDADRATFYDYNEFTLSSTSGFVMPHGVNVTREQLSVCSKPIMPSNGTWMNVTFTYTTITSPQCVKYDSTTKQYRYVLRLHNNASRDVQYDGSSFLVGTCVTTDLPQYINATHKVQDISSSTIAPKSGRSLVFYFSSQSARTSEEVFTPTTTITLGRWIFPRVCFTRGTPYYANADPYGIYVYSCQISNNEMFLPSSVSNPNYFTESVIDSNGCVVSTANPRAGRQAYAFRADPESDTSSTMFCAVSGGFKAFRWIKGSKKIYMKCLTKPCTNTQLFMYSKCKDSCDNTIVNSNITDANDVRKKRDIFDDRAEQEIFAVIDVEEGDESKPSGARSKECADPVMAKTVIGALVALLVLATIVAVILFWKLQNRSK